MVRSFASLFFLFRLFLLTAQPQEGLVARFSFNEGLCKDDRGRFQPKVYGARLDEDRFGNPKSAYYFQGNFDSYLNLGTSPLLKPKRGSISLWVKIDQQMFKGEGIHGNPIIHTRSRAEDDFNEGYAMVYHFDLRKLHCNTSTSELSQVTVYPSGTSYLQQWYHLVMTYDDQMLTFYVDGVMEGRSAKNFENKFLDGDSVIVGMIYGPKNKRYFQGTVDDICVYDRVLSSREVLQLYTEPDPNRSAVATRWILYGVLLLTFVFLLLGIVRWRINKALKKEKDKNQLLNNWYEQENKVLSAQMDPHFIFNSLNTIQQFIITHENEKAQLYLSKFSRLMRRLLESNTTESITLQEEIEIFKMYLEIESLRFNNVFEYKISVDENINASQLRIPHFLIQPIIENAIWHGLLPKQGDKKLSITFKLISEKLLSCVIDDNGIGRKASASRSASLEKVKKSLAINFIEQRLTLLSKLQKVKCEITFADKFDENKISTGTTVTITIPILERNTYVQSTDN